MRDEHTDKGRDKTKTSATADRRGFLKLAGAGAITGTAGVLGAGAAKAEGVGAVAPTGGYRETEHIRRYYDTAR